MIQYERQQNILQLLKKKKTATVRELAAAVYASEASVRRDIETLEKQGLVQRIYGGVMLSRFKNSVVPLQFRDSDHSAAKELIAERAASLVFDGATLILDASSTARRMLHYLNHRHDLKIITNNLQLFNEIGNCDAQLYCTGGTYIRENHAFTGALADSFIRKVSADFLFFSSQGISEDGEITDASEEETSLRRAMMSRAEHTYFLCDASKIGQRRLFTLCHKEELTGILCDAPLPWEENP